MNDGCVPARVICPQAWPVETSFVFGQAPLTASTLTLSSKVKPESKAWLDQAAREVNQVWNYCNEVTHKAWFNRYGGTAKWLSGFDMNNLLAGCGDVFDRIGIDVAQSVAAEHANKRNQFKRSKLNWRKSGGTKKSLGWIPFKANTLRFSLHDKLGKRVRVPNDPQPVIPSWPQKIKGESKEDYTQRKASFAPIREQAEREFQAWEYRRVKQAHTIKMSFMDKTIRLFNAHRLLDAYRLAKQGVGCLRSGCFAQDSLGDWYLNVVIDKVEVQLAPLMGQNSSVGIDPGQITAMTASDGSTLRSRRYRDIELKMQKAQKNGHKKQSKRLHRKAKRQRQDDRHKFCRSIINNHALVSVGDWGSKAVEKYTKKKNIENKNSTDSARGEQQKKQNKIALKGQAKSVYDAGTGAAFATLTALGHRAGRVVQKVNERNSTRRCSNCQALTGPTGLDMCVVRKWTCSGCGMRHNRDRCGSVNINHTGILDWNTKSPQDQHQCISEPRYWRAEPLLSSVMQACQKTNFWHPSNTVASVCGNKMYDGSAVLAAVYGNKLIRKS